MKYGCGGGGWVCGDNVRERGRGGAEERERDRQTDRQRDRKTEKRKREIETQLRSVIVLLFKITN